MADRQHTSSERPWSVVLISPEGAGQVSRHSTAGAALDHRQALLDTWPGKRYLIKLDDRDLRYRLLQGRPRFETMQLIEGWVVRDNLTGGIEIEQAVPDASEARAELDYLNTLDARLSSSGWH